MDELENVCRTMLDNADLDVEFTEYPFSVQLTFYVAGMDRKVLFNCSGIEEFSIVKDALDEPEYLCLEVNVKKPKKQRPEEMSDFDFEVADKTEYLWNIETLPDAHIKIRCLKFDWELLTMTDEEMRERTKT